MSLAVFVINLDTSRERMAQIETASEKAGLSLTRVAAIDGRVEDGTRWEGFDDAAFRRRNGRNALPGEIGCYRSHLKALDRFVQSGAPHGLILEDDALPTADTASRIAAIIDAAPDADVIRLISHRNRGFIARTETSAGDRLGTTLTGPQGSAAAYLVSRRGAERLLATLLPMSLPYDVALEQFWVNGADGYSVRDDVLGRSDHRNQSTIANTSHYDAAKFRATRRVSALVFRVCDGLRRASAALMPGKLAHLVEFPPYPALGFGRSPERTMPRWLQLLPVVAVLMLLSPV